MGAIRTRKDARVKRLQHYFGDMLDGKTIERMVTLKQPTREELEETLTVVISELNFASTDPDGWTDAYNIQYI